MSTTPATSRRSHHAGGLGHAASDFLPRAQPDKFVRAEASCVCAQCDRTYDVHLYDPYEVAWHGEPWFHVLCDGTRVKL